MLQSPTIDSSTLTIKADDNEIEPIITDTMSKNQLSPKTCDYFKKNFENYLAHSHPEPCNNEHDYLFGNCGNHRDDFFKPFQSATLSSSNNGSMSSGQLDQLTTNNKMNDLINIGLQDVDVTNSLIVGGGQKRTMDYHEELAQNKKFINMIMEMMKTKKSKTTNDQSADDNSDLNDELKLSKTDVFNNNCGSLLVQSSNVTSTKNIDGQLQQQQPQAAVSNKTFTNQLTSTKIDALEDESLVYYGNNPPVRNRNYQEARYKTELCLHYREQNRCPHGARCLFAHGLGDLRPYRGRHPKHKTQYCKAFHEHGFCNYGYRCSYIHSESPRTIDYIKRLNRRAQLVKRNRLNQNRQDRQNQFELEQAMVAGFDELSSNVATTTTNHSSRSSSASSLPVLVNGNRVCGAVNGDLPEFGSRIQQQLNMNMVPTSSTTTAHHRYVDWTQNYIDSAITEL